MPKSSIDPVIAENLRAILKRKGRSAYSVALAIGVAPNGLYQVLNGTSGILIPTLKEVAAELGVTAGELVDPPTQGASPSIADALLAHEPADEGSLRWHDVPIREVAPAAGVGATCFGERVVGYLPFRRDWLQALSIDPELSDVVKVRGDSMEPTLPNGSSILVDRQRCEPQEGGIYVLRTEEGLVVKRMEKDDKGRWQAVSDNRDWPPMLLTYGAHIVGEVRWVSRTL